MEQKLYQKEHAFTVKAVDKGEYRISGVFSTADKDWHDEIIDQSGWKLETFSANPVILFGHDHGRPAIGRGENLRVNALGQLEGDIVFAVKEHTDGFAETIFNLYANGFMRAFSVGFRNEVYEVEQESDTVVLKVNDLLEISCVNVPANAFALAKQKGLVMGGVGEGDIRHKQAVGERP
ncbi:MAG: HK97 family phage prohead protease, partial [Parcubacteria group bacterium]